MACASPAQLYIIARVMSCAIRRQLLSISAAKTVPCAEQNTFGILLRSSRQLSLTVSTSSAKIGILVQIRIGKPFIAKSSTNASPVSCSKLTESEECPGVLQPPNRYDPSGSGQEVLRRPQEVRLRVSSMFSGISGSFLAVRNQPGWYLHLLSGNN